MANIIVVAGLGAMLAAGAVTQVVRTGDTARVPAWLTLPQHVEISNAAGTPGAGQFDLLFAGASDEELQALRAGLEGAGFRFAMKPSRASGVSRTFVAHDSRAGRRIEIDLTELPDHDVWRVSYFESQRG